ncbi:MAG TPA: LysE family transporter [Candidatus Limiplasma sp.]|nr:LysE family transporter [Candidatus Limiplasma sp.]
MNWLSFIPYALITTFTPGPNNIMALSIATQNGVKRTLPFNAGVWAGFSVVIQLCALLSATLYAILPSIKTPMLFIGAAYLLYLAWKTWKSTGIHEQKTAGSGFLTGFLMQFINPKGIVYGIVSMETFVLPYYHDQYLMVVLLGLFMATLGFISTTCWATFGSLFKLLFSKYRKTVNAVLALLLVYCAVSLFL